LPVPDSSFGAHVIENHRVRQDNLLKLRSPFSAFQSSAFTLLLDG
jgi:hypothetical protein